MATAVMPQVYSYQKNDTHWATSTCTHWLFVPLVPHHSSNSNCTLVPNYPPASFMSASPTVAESRQHNSILLCYRHSADSAEQTCKHLPPILATTYVMVHTTRRVSRTTFWFVDTHIQTDRQTPMLKTIPAKLLWLTIIEILLVVYH